MVFKGGKPIDLRLLAVGFVGLAIVVAVGIAQDLVWPLIGLYLAIVLTVAYYLTYLQHHEDAFMWRHGKVTSRDVETGLVPDQIRAVVTTELHRQRGWQIDQVDYGVKASRGVTAFSYATRLHAEWYRSGWGQRVVVTSRILQLSDLGESKRTVARIIAALTSADAQGRGAEDSSQDTKPV